MPALNPTRRSRAPLRLIVPEAKPAPRMPVTVRLPEDFGADIDSIMARARQVQTATRGFTTDTARRGVLLDLEAIEALARNARERL